MAKILFVDDDEMVRYALCKYLRREGHDITEAEDGRQALELAESESFDIVITDIVMPNVEGLELIGKLLKSQSGVPIIAISGGGRVGREEYLSVAELLGVSATLEKPLDPEALVDMVDRLTAR